MNERTTLEVIAPTVEEAIKQRLEQLGLTADAVSVEVLDAGNKGFFGLGKPQVRVRLTVNPVGGPPPVETKPVREPKKETRRVEPRPVPQERPAPPRPPERPAPVKEVEPQPEHDPLLDHTEAVISRLLHLLNLEAQVSANYGATERDGRRNIQVDIRGKDLSVLIGRRSETLSAFQYVASLIVGKETSSSSSSWWMWKATATAVSSSWSRWRIVWQTRLPRPGNARPWSPCLPANGG